ncbi:MAG: hypothetical protein R3E97_24125 [Candidatus Eisenbacteria bacterium]
MKVPSETKEYQDVQSVAERGDASAISALARAAGRWLALWALVAGMAAGAASTSPAGAAPGAGAAGGAGVVEAAPTGVVVNGADLSRQMVDGFAQRYGLYIPVGRYWYDPACGAWGLEGGPALGITVAGANSERRSGPTRRVAGTGR